MALNLYYFHTIHFEEFTSSNNWVNIAGPPQSPPMLKAKDTTNTKTNTETTHPVVEQQQHPAVDGLPKRLITIVGLENSGTVFMHMAITTALGLKKVNSEESMNDDGSFVLQHTSLPAGFPSSDPQLVHDVGSGADMKY
jgi:hypothetical protein